MSWSLHQLFPICPVPHCPKYRTRHMLPHQEEIATQILTGDENYAYWQGGVGSAKTLLWGALAAALAIMIPKSRSILFRKDFGLNYETLWRYFKQSIEAACEQRIINAQFSKLWSVKKQGEYTICTLPNGSVIRCGQTKNWSEYMGPSYDFIIVSDAMENNNFGEIFRGEGVVGGLQSRLRGQASSFYQLSDGSLKDMRRFLIESNPPPNINELHAIFGKEPGIRYLPGTQISYRHIQTSSVQNDHNPSSYVAEIASQHPDPGDIKRILEGKTVPYYGGIRVVSTFYPEAHVSKFHVDEELPLFVGIDPGTQHPGVIFSQIKHCGYEKEHFMSLSEISNVYDKSTHQLVELQAGEIVGILGHLGIFYPEFFDLEAYKQIRESLVKNSEDGKFDYSILEGHFSKVLFCIDRSGEKTYSTSKDRETDRSILLTHYGIRCKYKTNIGLDRSLDRVREHFQEICICGIPRLLVDQNCELLIDAYSGGYRYGKNRDGSHSEKPVRDFRYEDIADAHRYSLENFFFSNAIEIPEQEKYRVEPENPYIWMYGKEELI
jgi:hypothetical protein